MEWIPTDRDGRPQQGFKLATIREVFELEEGKFWSQLHPVRTEYRRIRYSLLGSSDTSIRAPLSVRGATVLGELEVAFVADTAATQMSIVGTGKPEYCLTVLGQGELNFSPDGGARVPLNRSSGLVYRAQPDTSLFSTGAQQRMGIWIPTSSLTQRLHALLDGPVSGEPIFQPVFRWDIQRSQPLRHLVGLLMAELRSPAPMLLGSQAASRSFADLLIYAMLKSVPNSYSSMIERERATATPGTLRRAEAYIRAHVEEPIALHEVAAAANCSVRSLQAAFRNFRNTTPLLAIRHFRLEAARDALRLGLDQTTITEVALRFGFSNPSRFTRFYKAAFGESPAEAVRRHKS
jgi:AraC-like DNA-binding protein